MSADELYFQLLRPSMIHILRAAGFHTTRPSVLDTLCDLFIRYLTLLASSTATHAALNHNESQIELEDVTMAMQEVGVFKPQLSAAEEAWRGEEDMRGVEGFLDWVMGEHNKEIQRIAGLTGDTIGDDDKAEDFLTGEYSGDEPLCQFSL
jgi:transcription initiation factor TFIID subunit 3